MLLGLVAAVICLVLVGIRSRLRFRGWYTRSGFTVAAIGIGVITPFVLAAGNAVHSSYRYVPYWADIEVWLSVTAILVAAVLHSLHDHWLRRLHQLGVWTPLTEQRLWCFSDGLFWRRWATACACALLLAGYAVWHITRDAPLEPGRVRWNEPSLAAAPFWASVVLAAVTFFYLIDTCIVTAMISSCLFGPSFGKRFSKIDSAHTTEAIKCLSRVASSTLGIFITLFLFCLARTRLVSPSNPIAPIMAVLFLVAYWWLVLQPVRNAERKLLKLRDARGVDSTMESEHPVLGVASTIVTAAAGLFATFGTGIAGAVQMAKALLPGVSG